METFGAELTDAPAWLTRGRIPGLDALRAISIALVLAAHSIFAARHDSRPLAFGFLGVDVFFVISGFLITLLLIREQSKTGRISLKGFYRRRALRILPAYLVFLGAMAVAARIGWERIHAGDWAAALTYTMNFRDDPAWAVGHVWSLSMEEQFYLLWPPMVMLLSPRTAKRVLVACIALAPLFRVAAWKFLRHQEALGRMSFPARVEPIAAGCLLALLASDPRGRAWLNRWFAKLPSVLLGIAGLILVTLLAMRSKSFGLGLRSTCCAVLIPMVVWGCANARIGSALSRVLAWPPLVWLGILSYSIYLWQQPFMDGDKHVFACRLPASLGFALAAAVASYFLVERPFLQIKDRRKPAANAVVALETAVASA